MRRMIGLALASLVLPALSVAAPPAQSPAQAQAPAQAPSKATQAPAQAPAKTAQAGTVYRTYSYQPSMSSPDLYNGYTGRGPAYRTGPASQGFYRAGTGDCRKRADQGPKPNT